MAILDNLYRKCYNKCNDNNKKVISHQTGKNGLVRRFHPLGYKIPSNRQKRRTDDLHKIWEYKNPEIVHSRWTAYYYIYAVDI